MNEQLELNCQVPHSDAAQLYRNADIRTDLAIIAAKERANVNLYAAGLKNVAPFDSGAKAGNLKGD